MAPAVQQQQQQGGRGQQRENGGKRKTGGLWGHEADKPVEAAGGPDAQATNAGSSKRACLVLSQEPRRGYDVYWDGNGWWRQYGADFGTLSDSPTHVVYKLWAEGQRQLSRVQAELKALKASSSSSSQQGTAAAGGGGPACGRLRARVSELEVEVRQLKAWLAEAEGKVVAAEKREAALEKAARVPASMVHTIAAVTLELASVQQQKASMEEAMAAVRAELVGARAAGAGDVAAALQRAAEAEERVRGLEARETELLDKLTAAEANGRSLSTQLDNVRHQLAIAYSTDKIFREQTVPALQAELAEQRQLNDQLRAELTAFKDGNQAAGGGQQQQQQEPAVGQQQLVAVGQEGRQQGQQQQHDREEEEAAERPRAPIAGRTTGASSGKATVVVGLMAALLFVIMAIIASSSSSSAPALAPLLVSGATAVQQGMSATGRAVGQRVGIALSAEQAVSYWKAAAKLEAAGRREAMAQLLATKAAVEKVEADKAQANHALSQLRQRQHRAERALERDQADKARLGVQTGQLQSDLDQACLGAIDQAAGPADLWRDYELQKNLSARYKARLEEEADQRRALEVVVESLSHEVLVLHGQVKTCSDDKAATVEALRVCDEGRREAEAAAEQLLQDRRGACVVWASELALKAKGWALSLLPPRMRPVALNLFMAWAAMERASL